MRAIGSGIFYHQHWPRLEERGVHSHWAERLNLIIRHAPGVCLNELTRIQCLFAISNAWEFDVNEINLELLLSLDSN
jgi:hypothetical protein